MLNKDEEYKIYLMIYAAATAYTPLSTFYAPHTHYAQYSLKLLLNAGLDVLNILICMMYYDKKTISPLRYKWDYFPKTTFYYNSI